MSRKNNKTIVSDDYDDDDDETWHSSSDTEYAVEKDMENKIEKILKKTDISFQSIYKQPLIEEDKCKLIELFNIYYYMDDNTMEKYKLKNDIKVFFQESKLKYEKHKKLKAKDIKCLSNLKKNKQINDKLFDIVKLDTNESNKQIIFNEYKRLKELLSTDDEYNKLKSWIDWSLKLPYDKVMSFNYKDSKISHVIKKVYKSLNKKLYGMQSVKEKILSFLSLKLRNPNMKQCSLGLVGPPGVGKTLICRTIAEVLSFPFYQISFGGVSSPEFLKGHDYTYIGSHPGEIVKALSSMKYSNGIIFFDEFDKISQNKTICDALLHITDPVQNNEYRDNFLSDITINLSNIWFIYSMNEIPSDKALKDRIYYINIDGYSINDKVNIIRNYIIPSVCDEIELKTSDIIISDGMAKYIIEKSNDNNPGIRTIKRTMYNIITKIDFYSRYPGIIHNDILSVLKYPITVTKKIIDQIIDPIIIL